MSEEQKPTLQMVISKGELTPYYVDAWFRSWYGKWIENPDPTLDDHSVEGIELYDRMLRLDSQLSMCFRKRAGRVISLGWNILPADDNPRDQEIAEYVEEVFDEIKDFNISRVEMFKGISHGYRPSEILFRLRPDKKIAIERFRTRNSERFRFNDLDELVYIGKGKNQKEVMPSWKFVLNNWGSDETNYGHGLLCDVYPQWYFKANVVKSMMRHAEKFGIPWLIGKYSAGTSADVQNQFHQTLQKMLGGHVGTGPEGSDIQLLEANNANAATLFEALVDKYIDAQYAKIVLGQTLSTENESGTFALAKFQSKGEQALAQEDSEWQMAQMQTVVRTIVDLNFGPQESYPRWVIPYEENKDLVSLTTGWRGLVEMGVPITVGYALEQADLPIPAGVDTEALLEIKQQANPFSGFGGFGGDPAGGDDIEDPDPDPESNLAERSQIPLNPPLRKGEAIYLAEKKNTLPRLQAERRINALFDLAQNARMEGKNVYAGWIEKQIRAMKKATSLTELNAIWNPAPDLDLAKHHEAVLRSAELNGRMLYYKDAIDNNLIRWSRTAGVWEEIPTQVLSLTKLGSKWPLGPMSNGEAWKYFRGKIPMTASEYKMRNEAWRRKAFSIANLENEYVVKQVKREIGLALRTGTTLEDFVENARKIFETAGVDPLSDHHLRTVYLTNVHGAANGGRYAELKRDSEFMRGFFPYLMYVTAGDDAVRDDHAALDGLVLRRDDPLWETIYPPNGFNCRCQVSEISVYEAEERNIEPASGLPLDFPGPDPGFEHAPDLAA